jgi:hypothetical protein
MFDVAVTTNSFHICTSIPVAHAHWTTGSFVEYDKEKPIQFRDTN